jgi:hypothetical protein
MTKNIFKYNEFSDNKLYVFDFDDTLVKTPSFEEVAVMYLKEDKTVKDLLYSSLKMVNRGISDLKYENGRIFIDDPNAAINYRGNWIRRGKRLYLTTPDIFSYMDESLPKEIKKEVVDLYNVVENKCILTARPEGSREKIELTLKKLNLKIPKYGIYMRPDGLKNAGEWKGHKIVELVNKYKFNNVVFYDDNSRYIKKAKKVVNSKLPELNLEVVKIS